jgi:acylphosphatase
MAMVRARLRISGIVQGVFYRASTRDEARRLGLNGWVRNLDDGDVEALVEGPESAVEELIDWCRVGPPGAQVSEVAVERSEHQGDLKGFTIAY